MHGMGPSGKCVLTQISRGVAAVGLYLSLLSDHTRLTEPSPCSVFTISTYYWDKVFCHPEDINQWAVPFAGQGVGIME